jgi:hypothetical protein
MRWKRQIHPRPDYIFSTAIDDYDIHGYANWDEHFRHVTSAGGRSWHRGRSWQIRAGFDPQPDRTIHEHLMELINNTPKPILLFGKCSLSETWLTNNKITDAIFIVRDPIDAYDSFFGRRHPHWADRQGGIESISTAEHYCEQWNKVVYDFLCNHYTYNTPIARYEFLVQDLEEAGLTELAQFLKPEWQSQVKREFITPEIKECIEDLTCKYSLVLYNR